VVGEAGNAAECLRKAYELRPHVLVADAATFGLPAPEAERLLARESPQTKIVFLSTQENAASLLGASRTAGCTLRHTSARELVEMVRNSCRDRHAGSNHTDAVPENFVPVSRSEASTGSDRPTSAALSARERVLTSREREVLKLLAEGKTVRAAATLLGLSSKTVDAHKFNLMRKLGIHNKAELVMWAIQKKVVKIPANF